MSSQKADEGSSKEASNNPTQTNTSNADETLKKFNVRDLQKLIGGIADETSTPDAVDAAKHKFWGTQPVPRFDALKAKEDGPLLPSDISKVKPEPMKLLDGFEWVTVDMTNPKEVDDVYELLNGHYVEDLESMFRFNYSRSFLHWALKAPGWKKEWHVGIRASKSQKLIAFISSIPITLRLRKHAIADCGDVNFLCVHKKLRNKRLAPVLIQEITRRCNLAGTFQAIYTAGVSLTPPISICRYFHRSLDWLKLNEAGFSPLPPNSTKQRQILRYKLPERTLTAGLRPMEQKDVQAVTSLMKRYLSRMDMAQEFTEEETLHWLIHDEAKAPERVVWTFVVDQQGDITDFFSFYSLESTIIGNPKHNTVRAAYLFYYASDEAFRGDGKDKSGLKKRLNELIKDALIIAKKEKFDVFNALSLADNPLFLENQLFGPGDGKLNYYLYNWHTDKIQGGTDERGMPNQKALGGVGMVML